MFAERGFVRQTLAVIHDTELWPGGASGGAKTMQNVFFLRRVENFILSCSTKRMKFLKK